MTLLQHGPTKTDIESNYNVTPKTMREALYSPKKRNGKQLSRKNTMEFVT
jgi:hypothetical protein